MTFAIFRSASIPPQQKFSCCHVRLISFVAHRDSRPNSEDVGLRSRLVLVVEPYRAVWPEIVGIPCLSRETPLESIHPAARDHFSLSANYQIDLFRGLVMMGKV